MLPVDLLNRVPCAYIREWSSWYILVTEDFPLDDIDVMPAKENGVTVTFEHQTYNSEGNHGEPWRSGKICLTTSAASIARTHEGKDPIGNAEARLRWHIERALKWIENAANDSLVRNGDPFERPMRPETGIGSFVVHDEGAESFELWRNAGADKGIVVFDKDVLPTPRSLFAVAFEDFRGNLIRKAHFYDAGFHGVGNVGRWTGVWCRRETPVVLPPWKLPWTWRELREIGDKTGFDVDGLLQEIVRRYRGESRMIILMLGYPIPLYKGSAPVEMHWQSLCLPGAVTSRKAAPGFRGDEKGLWRRDRISCLKRTEAIMYVVTENWNPDRLQARGRVGQPLRGMDVALLGAGAMGSAVGEQLARMGVKRIIVFDGGKIDPGNIVRHDLTLMEKGLNKATALTKKMYMINPFGEFVSAEGTIPAEGDAGAHLESADIIIDCTGSDQALIALSEATWVMPKVCFSASLNYGATRLYLFQSDGFCFPFDEFENQMQMIANETEIPVTGDGEVLEGAGCWSPLWPGRWDDITLAASTVVKVMESSVRHRPVPTRMIVYDQKFKDGDFLGYVRYEAGTPKSERP